MMLIEIPNQLMYFCEKKRPFYQTPYAYTRLDVSLFAEGRKQGHG